MKRIAEIKKRREHVFWKNRCVHAGLFVAVCFDPDWICPSIGWPQPRRRSEPTEERSSQTKSLSRRNWWSRSLPLPRRYGRRSRSSPRLAVHLSLGKANRWVWRSTNHLLCFVCIIVHWCYSSWRLNTYTLSCTSKSIGLRGRAVARGCDNRNRLPLFVFGFRFLPGIWV